MRNRSLLAVVLGLCGALSPSAKSAEPAVLAIVVDRENPRTEITVEELRAIFLGQQREWQDGARIVPLELETGTSERDVFNATVLGMDQAEVDRFRVDQRMRGTGNPPRVAPSPGSLLRLAGRVRGVIGYVPLSAVDGSVKVLKVSGIAPGKPGYPLRGS